MLPRMTRVIVHYDEIALKGGRRKLFEADLVGAINGLLKAEGIAARARRDWGRIFIEPKGEGADLSSHEPFLRERLRLLPGISSFGFCLSVPRSREALLETAPAMAARAAGGTFRVTARRVDKSFPLRSGEIERQYGAAMLRAVDGRLKVSLKHYDHQVKVEVLNDAIVVYLKERGVGGLAVGSSGRVVSLLSAGFDSPVASFLLMKRGARIFPVHFHSAPATSDEPIAAVHDLCARLSAVQGRLRLALVPVLPIQRHLEEKAEEKLRIVLLRRSFMRLAAAHARACGAPGLVTGESLGQVASQTLANMRAIDAAADLPVLRPLCGMNKTEIIAIARMIGTEEISARPCEDTCALFVPRHPETKAKLDEVERAEAALELARLEEEALAAAEEARFAFGREEEA